jgi:hypothetical protein
MQSIKVGSVIIPYAMEKYGKLIVQSVFINNDLDICYCGKFENNSEIITLILNSKDILLS